jgi:hypothetical protein
MAFAQVSKWRELAPTDGGRYILNAEQEWYCVWCSKKATRGDGGHLDSIPHIKKLGNNGVELSDAQLRYVGWLEDDVMPDQLQIASGAPGLASGSTPGLDERVGPHNELDHLRRQIAYQRGEIMRMKVQIDEQIEKLALMMGIFDEQERRIEDIERSWQ